MTLQTIDPELVRQIVDTYVSEQFLTIPIGVSNRHLHLNREDLDLLFGQGYELHPYRELSQKEIYAAKETVVISGPKGSISGVRILGPLRKRTQLELLLSDGPKLGVTIPLRESGQSGESQPVTMIGPAGTIVNRTGIMVALRHIHMNTAEAAVLDLKDGSYVSVSCGKERSARFDRVKIRTGEFVTELHLDVDEANAAGIKNGDLAKILLHK